jgi:hypothetical protein
MRNNYGRTLGGNKMDRMLHFRGANINHALHAATADTYGEFLFAPSPSEIGRV